VNNLTNRKIIGFDMDGVIIDHSERKVILAKELGFIIKKTETTPEVMKKLLPEPKYRKLQYFLYDDPQKEFLPLLMFGVKPVLSRLKRDKVPFFVISRRQKHDIAIKLLRKHGLWPRFFNKKNSFFVDKIEDKEIVAKKLGITHYIDDDQRVLTALVSVKNKFLFDSLGVFKNSGYTRVGSWREISKLL